MSELMSAFPQKIVQPVGGLAAAGLANVGINIPRDGDAGVTEQLLCVLVRNACLIQDRGEAVPELVGGDVITDCLTICLPAFAVLRLGKRFALAVVEDIAGSLLGDGSGQHIQQDGVPHTGGCLR